MRFVLTTFRRTEQLRQRRSGVRLGKAGSGLWVGMVVYEYGLRCGSFLQLEEV